MARCSLKQYSFTTFERNSNLWTKFFEDPSQWWDNRGTKTNQKVPDFKHKSTREALWLDRCPTWVPEELCRSGFLSSTKHKNGDVRSTNKHALTSKRSLKAIAVDFVATLKTCARNKDLEKGASVHSDILETGLLENNLYVASSLINMYAKCGELGKAQDVLDKLPVRNVVSWSALIAGYAHQGQAKEALICFERMQGEGFSPDAVTFICMLKACGSLKAAHKGKQIHDQIIREGLLGKDVILGTALVDMYSKCGALDKAKQVLEELPVRDAIAWSALIAGYALEGQGEESLNAFESMRREGFYPDAVTFISLLKACGSIKAADKGKEIHDTIARKGFQGKDVVLGVALVDMYVKCGELTRAQKVLDELPCRNAVSWNALIAGYAQQGQGNEALKCFDRMQQEGLSPNAVTHACILKACGSVRALDRGKEIHDKIVKLGLLCKDVVLGNALVYMYARCGVLVKAREVFDSLRTRDVVSWSALIAGYVQQGQGEEALNCFKMMQCEGLSPDAVTFACVLKACGSIGAIDKGKQIHDEVVNQGLLVEMPVLGTALVDMYAKCGELSKAEDVLRKLPIQDVFSWNALIAGCAQQGQAEETFNCFERMQQVGMSPDGVTFSSLLNACSHSGLVDAGQMYYANMSSLYGVKPNIEHHTCMVDLFGRAGHFDKALAVIEQLKSPDHPPLWSAFLGACRKWQNVKLGRWAFDHAVQVDKHDSAFYVIMANIYSAAGMHEDAKKIEAMCCRSFAGKILGEAVI